MSVYVKDILYLHGSIYLDNNGYALRMRFDIQRHWCKGVVLFFLIHKIGCCHYLYHLLKYPGSADPGQTFFERLYRYIVPFKNIKQSRYANWDMIHSFGPTKSPGPRLSCYITTQASYGFNAAEMQRLR